MGGEKLSPLLRICCLQIYFSLFLVTLALSEVCPIRVLFLIVNVLNNGSSYVDNKMYVVEVGDDIFPFASFKSLNYRAPYCKSV